VKSRSRDNPTPQKVPTLRSRRWVRNVKHSLAFAFGLMLLGAPLFAQGTAPTEFSDPHGRTQQPVVHGSPFTSPAHRHQAELLRANRSSGPRTQNMPGDGIPAGTIGLLLRNEKNEPLAGAKVQLRITHESISDGNTDSTKETVTDAQGRGGFVGLHTESAYKYEVVIDYDGARYGTGEIRLRRDVGHIAVLYVFPTTSKIDDTFVITRLLYAIQPREDIFQIDTILRVQNGGTKTWVPTDFFVDLPEGAQAFRPAKVEADRRTTLAGNRVHITGSFTPGQHEFTFGFQVPNPRTSKIDLNLKTTPHLTDTRVFLEASDTMGLQVVGLRPAERTQGLEGQNALMAAADFLEPNAAPQPNALAITITGMPERGSGALVATGIAALLALFGVGYAASRTRRVDTTVSTEDRDRAQELLLAELVALENAHRAKDIGPKTYEQARRTLLDSLARLTDKDPQAQS
jgi:hypothetical protein